MAGSQNITELPEDPFTDVDLKEFYKQMDQTFAALEYMGYVTDTVKIMLNILVITADILIVVIMKRSRKFQTKTDKFIMHYAVWDIVYISPMNVIMVFLGITGVYKYMSFVVYLVLYIIEQLGLVLVFAFALGLGVEWLLNIYNPKLGERFDRLNKYLLFIVYGLGISLIIVVISLSFTYRFVTVRFNTTKLFYYSVSLTVLVLNWFNYRNKSTSGKRKSYALIIANIIIFLWMPQILYDHLLNWTFGHYIMYSIVLYTLFLPEWLCFGTPIVVVITLMKLNKYFDMGFWRLFKKRVGHYNDDTENLDESEDENNENRESGHVYL